MTAEIPPTRRHRDAITCDECGAQVRLVRENDVTLDVRCDCDDTARSIKVASALPRSWSG